jgi:hypothetical protein
MIPAIAIRHGKKIRKTVGLLSGKCGMLVVFLPRYVLIISYKIII